MELLESLMQQENLTVLFVSHDINDVRGMFPNTIMLRNGRMFAKGKTEELFQPDNLSKFFQQKVQIGNIEEVLITSADSSRKLKTEFFL